MKNIILVICMIFFLLSNCTVTEFQCGVLWVAPEPLGKYVTNDVHTNSTFSPDMELSLDPLLLPVKLIYDANGNFKIEAKNGSSILTPLGTLNIDYGIGAVRNMNVHGQTITGGDFVVALKNRNKKTKDIFLIKGFSKLKISLEGKTTFEAQNGYAEIDVTEAKIHEITFTNNQVASIVNLSDYSVEVATLNGNIQENDKHMYGICEIPPKSYIQTRSVLKDVDDGQAAIREIGIVQGREKKNFYKTTYIIPDRKILKYGNTYYIDYDRQRASFYMYIKENESVNTHSIQEQQVVVDDKQSNYMHWSDYGWVETESGSILHLREMPNQNSKSLIKIPNKATIKIHRRYVKKDAINNKSGYWDYVEYEGKIGYAWGEFIVW